MKLEERLRPSPRARFFFAITHSGRSIHELAHERLRTALLESGRVDEAIERIISGESDPYTLTRELFDTWCQGDG